MYIRQEGEKKKYAKFCTVTTVLFPILKRDIPNYQDMKYMQVLMDSKDVNYKIVYKYFYCIQCIYVGCPFFFLAVFELCLRLSFSLSLSYKLD
jgi:hypothetical protein